MTLLIVESPTKARTIKQFLGKDFIVKSSFGHTRDLPARELAINIEKNFKPKYIIIPKSKKIISQLKEQAQKTSNVILATDEDREGEAIAWHLCQALNLKEPKRIVFHEITKKAIEEALQNSRAIDMNLVDAQQARRVLDRLVGYKLSPLLWKKVARGLSAGRVQSVAVRLIVERQKEIDEFKPQEYWSIEAQFKDFAANLVKKDDKAIPKLGIKNKKEADEIVKDLKGLEYKVKTIGEKQLKRYPFPPFTTSTLQQEASRKLKFSAKQTMFIAQQLYEGIILGKGKSIGLITYMRTDSLNLASQAVWKLRDTIEKEFGKDYVPAKPMFFRTKTKGAQEAHEAIRPTFPEKKPEDIKEFLDKRQFALYNLIWQRAMACQMNPAIFNNTTLDIETNKSSKKHIYAFRANGNLLKFDGFLRVCPPRLAGSRREAGPLKNGDIILPKLTQDQILELKKLIPLQHFIQAPFPYTEATLVRALEENGIGRPSTYAPTLDTIQKRGYVNKRSRYLYPTDIGIVVNNLLVEHFPKIVDIKFTAKMEEDLDEIAEGKTKWVPVVEKFYTPFEKNLNKKYKEIDKKEVIEEKTDEKCEKCGSPMVIKTGRFGKFLACSNFPKCKNTKPIEKTLGVQCPECEKARLDSRDTSRREAGEIIERTSKKGRTFYACNKYPDCKFALWDKPFTITVKGKPIAQKCPKCGSLLVKTRGNKVKCSNKDCDYVKE